MERKKRRSGQKTGKGARREGSGYPEGKGTPQGKRGRVRDVGFDSRRKGDGFGLVRDPEGRGSSQRRRGDKEGRNRIAKLGEGRDSRGLVAGWIRREILRSADERRGQVAVECVAEGLEDFHQDRFGVALKFFRQAKQAAPRAPTIRSLVGLAAYHNRDWETARSEFHAFRRLTSSDEFLPMEMDSLRGLDRPRAVEQLWQQSRRMELTKVTAGELLVVYASFLLDQGRPEEADEVIGPTRLVREPKPGALRCWYVAAKVALALGQVSRAQEIHAAIQQADPDFPGLDELTQAIAKQG